MASRWCIACGLHVVRVGLPASPLEKSRDSDQKRLSRLHAAPRGRKKHGLEMKQGGQLIKMLATFTQATHLMPAKPASAFDKDAYLERLASARDRMRSTMLETLDWVSRLDVHAASSFSHVEPMLKLFPAYHEAEYCRISFDIHTATSRYGALGLSLKSPRMRSDFSRLTPGELAKLLKNFCSPNEAKAHAESYRQFQRFVERVCALKFLGVEFVPLGRGSPVVLRWFESIEQYGKKCRPILEQKFNLFLELTAQLDQAIFDFNAAMGAVRFRAIRCSYTVDEFDLLGPRDPEIKIVTYIHPVTKARRYNSIRDFKTDLRRRRYRKALTTSLGRPPEKQELQAAMAKERQKKPSPLITKEVVKACYMGRHAKAVFEAQENLVAAMQPWASLRAHLQALLQ